MGHGVVRQQRQDRHGDRAGDERHDREAADDGLGLGLHQMEVSDTPISRSTSPAGTRADIWTHAPLTKVMSQVRSWGL